MIVESLGTWPDTIDEYADMYDENAPADKLIKFTNKADFAAVKYNFFKMAFGPQAFMEA